MTMPAQCNDQVVGLSLGRLKFQTLPPTHQSPLSDFGPFVLSSQSGSQSYFREKLDEGITMSPESNIIHVNKHWKCLMFLSPS